MLLAWLPPFVASCRLQAHGSRLRPSRPAIAWSTKISSAPGVKNRGVIASMRDTPRHEFVPAQRARSIAYFDMALPIGAGQTISPPFIVAYMTEQLDPQPTDKVLEIGTGSGFQAAMLSPAGRQRSIRSRSSNRSASAPPRRSKRLKYTERRHQDRRRLQRLARARAVRQDHRHLLARKRAAAAGRSIEGRAAG